MSDKLKEKLSFIFEGIEDRFGVQIGALVWEREAEIFAHDGKKRKFGSGIDIRLGYSKKRDVSDYEYAQLTMNHGSCGSFDPSDDNEVGTLNAILRGQLVENWDKVKPILIELMKENYEKTCV
jgi:hypothetical protein